MERILEVKPNTKEYNHIRNLRETRERAENLAAENAELEKKMERIREEMELDRKELNGIKERHSKQVME